VFESRQPQDSNTRPQTSTKTTWWPNGIRIRVYGPPRAFLDLFSSYALLTQHRTPWD